ERAEKFTSIDCGWFVHGLLREARQTDGRRTDVASATPLVTILSRKLCARDLPEASHCRPPARRRVLPMLFRIGAGGRSETPTPVRNPLPRSTLDRCLRLARSQVSRVISSNWPYWTARARWRGRTSSLTPSA